MIIEHIVRKRNLIWLIVFLLTVSVLLTRLKTIDWFYLPSQASAIHSSTTGRIAFDSNRDGNFEIYVMNDDGTNQTRITNDPADDRSPVWSPDGSQIAFTSSRNGNPEVYVMNADGTNIINITDNPAHDGSTSWSPDGNKIAFFSDRDGIFQVYMMNKDGSNPVSLSNALAFQEFSDDWSPDGSKLTFFSERGGSKWDIFVMNVDGTNVVNLTNDGRTNVSSDWSPNGSKIVFRSQRDVNAEIYVMNADGTNQVNITNHPSHDLEPDWSPDGQKIAFHSTRDGNFEIYTMNADGTSQTNLSNNPADDTNPAWHPATILVSIDIKPGSDPNCFNNDNKGVIPVAILGSTDLDVTKIDVVTVQLESLPVKVVGKTNRFLAHIEDVNSDSFDDLVVQIEDADEIFQQGTGTANLTGHLLLGFGGTFFKGTDSICITQ